MSQTFQLQPFRMNSFICSILASDTHTFHFHAEHSALYKFNKQRLRSKNFIPPSIDFYF